MTSIKLTVTELNMTVLKKPWKNCDWKVIICRFMNCGKTNSISTLVLFDIFWRLIKYLEQRHRLFHFRIASLYNRQPWLRVAQRLGRRQCIDEDIRVQQDDRWKSYRKRCCNWDWRRGIRGQSYNRKRYQQALPYYYGLWRHSNSWLAERTTTALETSYEDRFSRIL